jgi:hypothetical protein
VVAKMLSRSESWARSPARGQGAGSGAMGAVLERAACEGRVGVTSKPGESGESEAEGDAGGQAPLRASLGAVDLTDAGGEVFEWASRSGDMGSTLVKPSKRRE